jgi:Domain of unknown function (DUF4189)
MTRKITMIALATFVAAFAGGAINTASAAGALVSAPVHGTYYYMTHRQTQDLAAQLALSDCAQHFSRGCHVLTTYEAGCIAIAQSEDGSHHSGWAVKPSMEEARLLAFGQCAKYGGPCRQSVLTCE